MTYKNRTIIGIENGVPGVPLIDHKRMQHACDRFLAKRGLHNPGFRRSEWLFGRMSINQRRAA